MTQMNLSTKQKQTYRRREQTCGCHGEVQRGRDGPGIWGWWLKTITYGIDKPPGPTVEHRELYSISCDKPQWKRIQNACV